MTENQKLIWGLGVLLAVSLVINVYLYDRFTTSQQPNYSAPVATSSAVFNAPGFKSEVVTVYDGSHYRTYATSTPLSDADIKKMREEMRREFDRMNEFFRRQDELFRMLWEF
jgi:hypothetical protein